MKLLQRSVMRSKISVALLALGSLAVASCGDNLSLPPDASRPPDAGTAIDGALAFRCDAPADDLEPNDTAETAPVVLPTSTGETPASIYGDWIIEACLGNGNQDWYRIDASQLRWDLADDFDGTPSMQLHTVIAGTGVCADIAACNEVRLPDAPENTVTVSVYRASDMELLATKDDTHGVLKLTGANASFDEDLLVSVSGPPEALYVYRLNIFLDVTGSIDECEC